jgi:predicted RNA-binding Zn-ribbon protein involved in translation (DUF1610 family)
MLKDDQKINIKCPVCGSEVITILYQTSKRSKKYVYTCSNIICAKKNSTDIYNTEKQAFNAWVNKYYNKYNFPMKG